MSFGLNNSYLRQIAQMNGIVNSITPQMVRSMRAFESATRVQRQVLGAVTPMIEASLALQRSQRDVKRMLGIASTTMAEHAMAANEITRSLRASDLTQFADAASGLVQAFPMVDTGHIQQVIAPAIAAVDNLRWMIPSVATHMQVLGHQLDSGIGWARQWFPTIVIPRSPFDRALATAAWADAENPFSPEVDGFLFKYFGDLIDNRNDLTYARLCFNLSLAPKVRGGALIEEQHLRQCLRRSIWEGRHQAARVEGPITAGFITSDGYDDVEVWLLMEQFLDTIPNLDQRQRSAMVELLKGYRWSEALRLHGVSEAGRKKLQRSAREFALFIGRPDLLKRKNEVH